MSARPLDVVLALFVAVVAGIPLALARRVDLSFDASAMRPVLAVSALAAVSAWARFRGMTSITPALRTVTWGIVLSNAYLPATYALARRDVPLSDARLAAWDHTVGFDTASVVALVRSLHLGTLASIIYDLLVPLLAAAVIVPPLLGRVRVSERLLLAVVLAAVPALAVFALLQGVGPWVHGAFEPSAEQRSCEATIALAKRGAPLVVSFADPAALVAFPSWHAILGCLAGLAFADVPRLRVPTALLAAGIVASTLATGWHYGVDVVAGVALAVACHCAAGRILDRLARRTRSITA